MAKKLKKSTWKTPLSRAYEVHENLLKTFDWEHDKSIEAIKEALKTYVDLYEYAQYDASLVDTNEDFVRLLQANIKLNLTNTQAKALQEVIDFKLNERFK